MNIISMLLNNDKKCYAAFVYLVSLLLVFVVLSGTIVPVRAADVPLKAPRLEIIPPEGTTGTAIYLRIYDFSPKKNVIVLFGTGGAVGSGTIIATKEITDDDGYAIANFVVDLFPGGKYSVTVDDGTIIKSIFFRVLPKITLNETSGCVGDTIIISGNGFVAKKTISAFVDDKKVATADADDKGSFNDLRFIVPPVSRGDHIIKVQDSDGNAVTKTYTIRQKMNITPTSATVGTDIVIEGAGFQAKGITIYFDDKDVAVIPVSTDGILKTTYKIPPCGDGVHKIKADDGINRAYCDLTVIPSVAVTPLTGHVGMQVGIQGSGFRPGLPMMVSFDNTKMEAPVVSNVGSFTYNLKVPKGKYGSHIINISDGINNLKSTFTVESTPPLAPALKYPLDGIKLEEDLRFEWNAVDDPSGVVYDFEIAEDSGFARILLHESNVFQPNYAVPREKKLVKDRKEPYYWRARAIDNASNIGAWSAVGSFQKSGSVLTVIANMPEWTKFILLGLGFIFVVYLLIWFAKYARKQKGGYSDDGNEEYAAGSASGRGDWESSSGQNQW